MNALVATTPRATRNPLARLWDLLEQRYNPTPRHWDVAVGEVQGLLFDGFEHLPDSAILLTRFAGPGALGQLLADFPMTGTLDGTEQVAINIALSYHCFEWLGLPERTLRRFDVAFREGIAAPDRSARLGDLGDNAPQQWLWGSPSCPRIDAAIMLFAADAAQLAKLRERVAGCLNGSASQLVHELHTSTRGGREHFGFRDGRAQPRIATRASQSRPGLLKLGRDGMVAPGEFLLGYSNVYGELRSVPWIPAALDPSAQLRRSDEGDDGDFGSNGSYMVLRQLQGGDRGSRQTPAAPTADRAQRDRIIDRSRAYGSPPSPPAPEGGGDRGLAFIAFGADLARQFELMQEPWINLPSAQLRQEVDSSTGTSEAQRHHGLPQLVTVRGGSYLFLPSLSALRFLERYALERNRAGD